MTRVNQERTSESPAEVLAGDMDIGDSLTPTRRSRRLKQRVNMAVDVAKPLDPSPSEQLTPPDLNRKACSAKRMSESESDEDGEPRKRLKLHAKENVKGFTDAQIKKFLNSLKKFPSPLTRIEKVAEDCGLSVRSLADLKELGEQVIRGCKAAVADQKAKEVADGLHDEARNRTAKPREKEPVVKVCGVTINAKTMYKALQDLEPLGEIIPVDKVSRKTWKLDFKVKVVQLDVAWTLEDDTKLLLGIWEYGMGSWKQICESDPVLKEKILFQGDSKPLLKHLHTRAGYLLGLIKKYHTLQQTNTNENYQRNVHNKPEETSSFIPYITEDSIEEDETSKSQQQNLDDVIIPHILEMTDKTNHQESKGPIHIDVTSPVINIATGQGQSTKPAGLKNIGNSCYMNAVMQALFSLPLFKEYVMTNEFAVNGPEGEVCTEISKAFLEMNRGNEPVDLSKLQNAFQIKKPSFQGHAQQDAQEFLLNLIDALDNEYKRLCNSFKMKEFFEGQVISTVTCKTCKNESPRSEPFAIFSLPLPTIPLKSTITLLECLQMYSAVENLTDYQCSKCKTSGPASLYRTITKLPKYFIIHFQRSKSRQIGTQMHLSKLKTDVTFPLNDLQIRLPSNQDPVEFQLRAICNHLGKTLKSGHYTAFSRSIDKSQWWKFNDAAVDLVDAPNPNDKICTSDAYIVIYEQLSSPTTDAPATVQPIIPSNVSQPIPTPLNRQRTTGPGLLEFPFKCENCFRVFKTEKGLNNHRHRYCPVSNICDNGIPFQIAHSNQMANFSEKNSNRCRLLTSRNKRPKLNTVDSQVSNDKTRSRNKCMDNQPREPDRKPDIDGRRIPNHIPAHQSQPNDLNVNKSSSSLLTCLKECHVRLVRCDSINHKLTSSMVASDGPTQPSYGRVLIPRKRTNFTSKEYFKEYIRRPEVKARRRANYQNSLEARTKVAAYHKEYNQRPEVKARKNAKYQNSPQEKARVAEYQKLYHQRPDVKARFAEKQPYINAQRTIYLNRPEIKAKVNKRQQKYRLKIQALREAGDLANQSNRIGIPQNKLLEYLELNQYRAFASTGVNILKHLRSLTLTKLIDKFPNLVSDKFLRTKKSYWIYILVALKWKEIRNMALSEIEAYIKTQVANKKRKLFIYVGLNSGGRKANPYHAACKHSTPRKYYLQGYRVFEAHFLNCNIASLDLRQVAGKQLRDAVLEQDRLMRRMEAFLIRFGKARNGRQFTGMQQILMNSRDEPVSKPDAKQAVELAATGVEFFSFDPNIKTPPVASNVISSVDFPFRLLKELKFR